MMPRNNKITNVLRMSVWSFMVVIYGCNWLLTVHWHLHQSSISTTTGTKNGTTLPFPVPFEMYSSMSSSSVMLMLPSTLLSTNEPTTNTTIINRSPSSNTTSTTTPLAASASSTITTSKITTMNDPVDTSELIHRAFYGLGHRLHRTAAAWHLARSLGMVTHFRFQWETCLSEKTEDPPIGAVNVTRLENTTTPLADAGTFANDTIMDYNIFRYLFGNDVWDVQPTQPSDRSTGASSSLLLPQSSNHTQDEDGQLLLPHNPGGRRKMIVIRNDIPGYIKGQLYKDLQLPLLVQDLDVMNGSSTSTANRMAVGSRPVIRGVLSFADKCASDVQFYNRLVGSYRHKQQVDDFMREHHFHDRFVVGLHLRAGNGEGMHFDESGRRISNEHEFVNNVIHVLGKMLSFSNTSLKVGKDTNSTRHHRHHHHHHQHSFPPLIFLATDTAYLIPVIQNASQTLFNPVETVVLPQYRLDANKGVTFMALEGSGLKCLRGWQSMVSDMILLSHTDVLVAAKHSTFTQSLPMALVLHDGRSFCEASDTGNAITCMNDIETWLFRNDDSKTTTYSNSDDDGGDGGGVKVEATKRVVSPHRVTLLLPDVTKPLEFDEAQTFLAEPWNITDPSSPFVEATFLYGNYKVDQKYRNAKPLKESKWNFVGQVTPDTT